MNIQELKQQSKIHFIGLGGIGMSALAFILRKWKIPVQGSDLTENYLTPKLREAGATYFVGHDAKNISDDVSLIVETSIIKKTNPEIIEAHKRNIPVITRANLLALIMREYKGVTIAGTHGKTSTTGIVALMLEIAGLDPTVINGGVIHYFGSNSKVGKGKYLVAESDESDASFVDLPSFIGAVTNIEPEHLEFAGYAGSFEKQKVCFEKYINQIPDEGLCVLCLDSPEVVKIYDKLKSQKKNLVTYSVEKSADLVAKNIMMDSGGIGFDVSFKDGREIKNIRMPVYGKHNASNALVAVAIADFLGVSEEKIRQALASFNGVKRRFTKVGEFNGAAIIDDYGHHPTEIKTTLAAARALASKHKVICVFEPHKYSRVRDLFNEFCAAFADADYVIVSDIYSAGQAPIEGVTQDALIDGIKKTGHKNVIKLDSDKNLAHIIKPLISSGDIIFATGAGKVTYWAAALAEQLGKLLTIKTGH
ncbi:MAG: UDP-N-acetylmuramate--L-alanine ligase [Alphaproteobacteria bacterium]|nr:UDP-N-acetylmuramate--L-alanine ligase [Alphaproteobacteria bacterium]